MPSLTRAKGEIAKATTNAATVSAASMKGGRRTFASVPDIGVIKAPCGVGDLSDPCPQTVSRELQRGSKSHHFDTNAWSSGPWHGGKQIYGPNIDHLPSAASHVTSASVLKIGFTMLPLPGRDAPSRSPVGAARLAAPTRRACVG